MKRLIRSIVIFTFVMIAGVAGFSTEAHAEEQHWVDENGYIDEYGVLHYTGGAGNSREEIDAIQDQMYYEEYLREIGQDSSSSSSSQPASSTTSSSSNSSSSSTSYPSQETSSAPKYTDAEIEAAWVEISRTEATCTNDGIILYENSLTKDTKSEVISAFSHTAGEPEITKEAGMFSEGTQTISCAACGELISTETIPQTCPLPLSLVVAFGAGAIVLFVGILYLIIRKRKKLFQGS